MRIAPIYIYYELILSLVDARLSTHTKHCKIDLVVKVERNCGRGCVFISSHWYLVVIKFEKFEWNNGEAVSLTISTNKILTINIYR